MARLDRELIVDTALALLDDVGVAGLTTRRLAERLGVRSPALYWHFPSKAALLDAVADAMLDQQDWPGPDMTDLEPAEWLALRAHAFRHGLLAHRDGAIVHAGTRPRADRLPALELQLAALVVAGFSPDDALRLTLAISRFTVGWVLEEQADAARDADPDWATREPSADLPTLNRAHAVARERDRDRDFDFGVRALIEGAMARAEVTDAAVR